MAALEDLLLSVGVDPGQPSAEALALCFRSMPIRRSTGGGATPLEEIFERGYFEGIEECRQAMEIFRGKVPESGSAFGISWPWIHLDGALVAPGLPLRLRTAEEEGPDGVYRYGKNRVLREASGEERIFLECGESGPEGEIPFDLLCFGPMERYLLEGGRLSVEDLFCRLQLPVSSVELDRIFVRGLRLDPALIEGLPCAEPGRAGDAGAVLSIAHPAEHWSFPDPAAFFGIRADVREVSFSGGELELRSERGEQAVFQIEWRESSWKAELSEGSYPLRGVGLRLDGGRLHLEVRPSAELDLLAPGKRGRLTFDLHSDCVMLAKRAGA